jgi:hypothetical protein
MTSSQTSRLGTSPEEAIKAPVVVETTANIALSGTQTINTVAVLAGNRVLVKNQSITTENGIWVVSNSAWSRSTDWNDAKDVVNGVLVLSAYSSVIYQGSFSGSYLPGETVVAFTAELTNDTPRSATVAALESVPTIGVVTPLTRFAAEKTTGSSDGFSVIFRTGDQSVAVAADTYDEWVVPTDRAADGSEGAWQRTENVLIRNALQTVATLADLQAIPAAALTEGTRRKVLRLGAGDIFYRRGSEWTFIVGDYAFAVSQDVSKPFAAKTFLAASGVSTSEAAWVKSVGIVVAVFAEEFGNLGLPDQSTSTLQSACDYASSLGGGSDGACEVILPALGIISDGLELPTGVTLVGQGGGGFSNNTNRAATILKYPFSGGSSGVIVAADNKFNTGLRSLALDGQANGPAQGVLGFSLAAVGGSKSQHSFIERVQFVNLGFGLKGDLGSPPGGVDINTCLFMNNRYGAAHIIDSHITGTKFSSNYNIGLWLTGGQIRVEDNFFEFHRNDGTDYSVGFLASEAIRLDNNSEEIIISGNQFDRNAGNDIKMSSYSGSGPERHNIFGNTFKRGAWGEDLPKNERYAIYGTGVDGRDISIHGNHVQTASYLPSSVTGTRSPLGFVSMLDYQRTDVRRNFLPNTMEDLDFSIYNAVESAVTGEFYFVDPDGSGNPFIDDPDFLEYAGLTLSQAGIGSLTNNTWNYGDNDSLGFSTIYVKITGSSPVKASLNLIYDQPLMALRGNGNIQCDNYRDRFTLNIAGSATTTFNLRTRRKAAEPFSNLVPLRLEFSGDQEVTLADAYYEFPFTMRRVGATSAITIKQGAVITHETGFAANWATIGTAALEVTITASRLGSIITVSIENKSANRIDLRGGLLW